MVLTIALSIASIGVSVILFLLGYWRIDLVRKEKARNANQEIETMLIRRIVLEEYKPTISDIGRLVEGKAIQNRVKIRYLNSEEEILCRIFAKIVENDFITYSQRDKILNIINTELYKLKEEPMVEIEKAEEELVGVEKKSKEISTIQSQEVPKINRTLRRSIQRQMLMAVIISTLGALIFMYANLIYGIELTKYTVMLITMTFSASLGIIIILLNFFRSKEYQEEPKVESYYENTLGFEREVRNVFSKLGIKQIPLGPNGFGDFFVEVHNKKIIIEVKSWSRQPPTSLILSIAVRLTKALNEGLADEGIIVTKSPIKFNPTILVGKNIRIMSLKELKNYLANALEK